MVHTVSISKTPFFHGKKYLFHGNFSLDSAGVQEGDPLGQTLFALPFMK